MKFSATIFTLLFSVIILAFGNNRSRKHLEGMGFRYIPPGVLQMDTGQLSIAPFFMYQSEISNSQYQEFLHALRKAQRYSDLKTAAIDSSGWLEALHFENTYATDYHLTAAYAEYPVVNISYEGALLFCEYLQELIRKKIPEAEVRLPNENEWIYAAKGGKVDADYPWENIGVGGKKEVDFCNYNSPDDGTCLATNYAQSYFPNTYGLYNMSGNAAEMLMERGRTKGGSWNSSGLSMRISSDDEYAGFTGSSPYIGFRPVVILP